MDALSEINIYRPGSSLDITAKYAPTIRQNKLENATITIDHDYHTPIDVLVQKIKSNQVDEKTYIGRIKGLDAAPDPKARAKGKITMVFINEDQNKSTASVVLEKDDYDAATDAHRGGKTIKVIGTMSGQTYKKIDCVYFEVLE